MKKTTSIIAASLILLVGIIVALSVEMVSSIVYDEYSGTTPTGIGLHIFIVMVFVTLANSILILSTKKSETLCKNMLFFHGAFELTGLFFGIASAYQARAKLLYDYFGSMNGAPNWYGSDVTGSEWFRSIPMVADNFSSSGTNFYILTIIGVIVTVFLAMRTFGKSER